MSYYLALFICWTQPWCEVLTRTEDYFVYQIEREPSCAPRKCILSKYSKNEFCIPDLDESED